MGVVVNECGTYSVEPSRRMQRFLMCHTFPPFDENEMRMRLTSEKPSMLPAKVAHDVVLFGMVMTYFANVPSSLAALISRPSPFVPTLPSV